MPEMSWKISDTPEVPDNIRFEDDSLKWDYSGANDHRFAIYITDDSAASSEIIADAQNLYKLSFSNTVAISDLSFSNNSLILITAVSAIGTESVTGEVFVVDTDLPTVEIISPDENEYVGVTDSLKWYSATQNAIFYVEIATDISFGNIIYEQDWINTNYLVVNELALNGETTYFWRVRAKLSSSGPFCLPSQFITGFPRTPEITYPETLDNNVSTIPVIRWDASILSDQVRVLISTSSSFETFVVDELFDASAEQGQISTELEKNSWYYLKVSAINEYGECAFSDAVIFETTSGTIPDVVIIGPEDNSTVASFDKIMWGTSVTETVTYLLEISLDGDFSSSLYSIGWTENTEIEISTLQLEGNRTYYWHMKAQSEHGESEFTETRSFLAGYPTRPSITLPAHLATNISVQAEIGWNVDENTDSVYVEFSKYINFSSVYITEQFDATPGTGNLVQSLRGYTRYYWHISAQNEYGNSIFSDVRWFETGEGNGLNNLAENSDLLLVYQDINKNLNIKLNDTQEIREIKIIDILGRNIYSRNLELNPDKGQLFIVERSVFPNSGIYIISVITENTLVSKKILIGN